MLENYQIRNGILESYTGREETVVVPEGVHTLGEGAFKACVSIKKLVLPNGLRCIMEGALKGCRRLEEAEIPEGVSYIGNYAFHRCHALKKIVLPSSVEELGDCVFLYCDSLTEARIPGVKKLGKQVFVNDVLLEKLEISQELEGGCICDVFNGCGRITEISFAGGECCRIPNAVEAAAGGMPLPPLVRLIVRDILRMMELDGRCLIRFLTNLKHVEIPEGIESLAKGCFFDKRGILSVKLPKSLKEIGSRAFRNCINLEEVSFGGEGVRIHEDAFRNCTSLKTVRTKDGTEYVFAGISGMTGTKLPEEVKAIQKQVMGNFRISGTILLKYLGEESRVVVPDGITRIAGEAFAGNEAIDRVILPESVREIGAEAFRDCVLLQTISFPEGLWRIGAGAFENCVKLIRVCLPSNIRQIEAGTFRHCRTLREVSFPEGLYKIGESAFYGCSDLKKIQFPESLVQIKKMAFYRCSGLKEVRLLAKTEDVESLAFAKSGVQRAWISASGRNYGRDVFGDCEKLKCLVLEEGVQHIPDKLAFGCASLKQVVLPESLSSVGRHALEGTDFLEQWKRGEHAEDAVFWDGQQLEGTVRLSEDVRIVAGGAFYGNTKITEIYLPDNIYWIGSAALKGCKRLRKAAVPSAVHCLEPEVFAGCDELEEVILFGEKELPAWHSIGERAFYKCSNLRRLRLDQAENIGKEALSGCSGLVQSAVKAEVQIGEHAFKGTRFLRGSEGIAMVGGIAVSGEACRGEVYLPKGAAGIAPYAFAGNRNITKVVLPEGFLFIGEGAFLGCSGLLAAEFPKTLQRIEARAFEKCSALSEVETFAQQIKTSAFAGCISLVRAALPEVSILEERLFAGCISMKECICEKAETVLPFCFSNCRNLKNFSFRNLSAVGAYAFERCESLAYAEFQDEVCLNEYALKDCCGLEKISLSGEQGKICVREYALSGCTDLWQIIYRGSVWEFRCYQDIFSDDFPEPVKLLFYSAFSCFEIGVEENLCSYQGEARKVRIPKGIRRIETEAFRDALMLQEVEISESVAYIGARAFHGTAWLKERQKESPMVTVRDMLLDGSGCMGEVTVPADIRLVCGWAFANGMGIERIRFLSDQVRVEAYAFRNCIFLQEVILPDGSCVKFTGIKDGGRELPPLAKQAVMDSLNCFKTDEKGVLTECTGNISALRLANGITAIGDGAFQDGNLLTEVVFPETVRSIGKRAFAGCKWLKKVLRAQGVEAVDELAFSGCGRLEYVELSEKFHQLGARAFENCTSLKEIRIPEGVEEIPEKAFYRCHSLKRIQLPSTLKRIGREAFAFCGQLEEVCLPKGVFLEERAFYKYEKK